MIHYYASFLFSRHCSWGLRSLGIWRSITASVHDVSKQRNCLILKSRNVQEEIFIFRFYFLTGDHYGVSKCREPITQWGGVIYQNTDTAFPDQQAPKIRLWAADNSIGVEEMRAFFKRQDSLRKSGYNDYATGLTVRSLNLATGNRFSLLQNLPDRLWCPLSLLFNGYRNSFPEVKRPGREVDHSPPCIVEVKNGCSCTSTQHFSRYPFRRVRKFARSDY
jgi:hypothetical protein